VTALNAKRLVIDSFSAMAQAFKEPIEARSILHNVLEKIVRSLGCTYPSGIPELDEIFGEGYPRGSSVLYELGENVQMDALHSIINPTAASFIMRGRGSIVVPPIGCDPIDIMAKIASFTGEEKFDERARVLTLPSPLIDANKPYVIGFYRKF
jgi:hypothetical protein